MQLGVGQEPDVLVERHRGVDPRRGGIHDGHAGAHPGFEGAAVEFSAERRELDAVVGALHLPAVFGDDGGDAAARGAGQGQDIGEVLFALGVVRGDVDQRVAQDGGVEGVDAGVDLTDFAFGAGGVLVFADSRDGSVFCAEDATVAGGVLEHGGEDGDGVALGLVGGDELAEQAAGEQRDVAVRDHDRSAQPSLGVERVERFQCRLDRAAGAGHIVLVHNQGFRIEGGDVGGHEVAFMPDHQGQLAGADTAGRLERVADQRAAADLMENLGGTGFHPGTGPCS